MNPTQACLLQTTRLCLRHVYLVLLCQTKAAGGQACPPCSPCGPSSITHGNELCEFIPGQPPSPAFKSCTLYRSTLSHTICCCHRGLKMEFLNIVTTSRVRTNRGIKYPAYLNINMSLSSSLFENVNHIVECSWRPSQSRSP